MNNFFTLCEMVIRTSHIFLKNGIEIKLPFYFHIKDIEWSFFEKEKENIIEEYSKEFLCQYEDVSLEEKFINLLRFVDLKQFTFDEDICEEYKENVVKYKNNFIFKNHESLYSFLISFLQFSEMDFSMIEKFVNKNQARLAIEFRKMCEKQMDLGNKKDDASESYMTLRCAFELNKPPLFYENIDKDISSMSYRELIAQRIYMSRKCEIEKIQYEEIRKKQAKNK